MQKRSHILLARTLLDQTGSFGKKRFELAFLFGSFQPDCNPLSYLKGSLRGRALMGHNYSNSCRYIHRRIRRLQQRDRWSIWQYYTLGKLTHYVADAFTLPHNETYTESLGQHRLYEQELRRQMPRHIGSSRPPLRKGGDLSAALERLHRQYLSAASFLQRDMDYIWEATGLLMASLLRSPALSAARQ